MIYCEGIWTTGEGTDTGGVGGNVDPGAIICFGALNDFGVICGFGAGFGFGVMSCLTTCGFETMCGFGAMSGGFGSIFGFGAIFGCLGLVDLSASFAVRSWGVRPDSRGGAKGCFWLSRSGGGATCARCVAASEPERGVEDVGAFEPGAVSFMAD